VEAVLQRRHAAPAHGSAQEAHRQIVAHGRPVYLQDVPMPAPMDPDAARGREVLLPEEHEVHDRPMAT